MAMVLVREGFKREYRKSGPMSGQYGIIYGVHVTLYLAIGVSSSLYRGCGKEVLPPLSLRAPCFEDGFRAKRASSMPRPILWILWQSLRTVCPIFSSTLGID